MEGGWQEIGSTPNTNYSVNQLLPNNQYWWFVFANNSIGSSSYSTEFSTFTNSATVPDPPTGLME
jgi:hypothetical protein